MVIPIGYAQANFRLKHDNDQEEMLVTLGVSSDEDPIGQNTADTLRDIYENELVDLHPSAVTFVGVDLLVGSDGGSLPYFAASGEAGTTSGPWLPQNCAALIRKATAAAGRRNRGRWYWPYVLRETDVDDVGNLTSSRISALNSALNSFLVGLAGASTQVLPEVLHNDSTIDPTRVTGMTCEPVLATQRRRLRR